MEYVIQPTVIPSNNYIAAMITLNTVTASVIVVRLFTHFRHHGQWFVDDYLCVVGLAFVSSYSATSSMMNKSFNSNPHDIGIEFITSLAAACIFTATAAMYFAKIPILIFVMRSFGVQTWLRYTGYFLMVFTALCFLASAMWTGVHCSPGLHAVHDTNFLFGCVKSTFYTTVSRNSLSLAVDVVIFVLPLPSVAKLNLSRRKKIAVFIVFLTGSFGIAAAVASLYYQAGQAAETSSNITNAMLTTIIECCTFLMVSCAPALRLFWVLHLSKTGLATRLGISGSPKSSQGSDDSVPVAGPRSNSARRSKGNRTPNIIVTTNAYIELNDAPRTGPVTEYTANINEDSNHTWTHSGHPWEK